MVPGGAPVIIFLTTAQQTDIQTAVGAVMLTGLFYFLVLPVFARCLKFFPKLVIGTMLLLVAINLVKVYGGIITGAPNSPNFAAPSNVSAGAGDGRFHAAVRAGAERHPGTTRGAVRPARGRDCRSIDRVR